MGLGHPKEDGHEERSCLGVGGGVVDYGTDKDFDLGGGECEAVALAADDVDGVDWGLGLDFLVLRHF